MECKETLGRIAVAIVALTLFGALSAVVQAQDAKPSKPLLDLNTASAEELQTLPGIGPSTAKAIVRFREKSGPFRRVEDLLAIRGITKKKLEKIRPLVTVKRPESRGERLESRRNAHHVEPAGVGTLVPAAGDFFLQQKKRNGDDRGD